MPKKKKAQSSVAVKEAPAPKAKAKPKAKPVEAKPKPITCSACGSEDVHPRSGVRRSFRKCYACGNRDYLN